MRLTGDQTQMGSAPFGTAQRVNYELTKLGNTMRERLVAIARWADPAAGFHLGGS